MVTRAGASGLCHEGRDFSASRATWLKVEGHGNIDDRPWSCTAPEVGGFNSQYTHRLETVENIDKFSQYTVCTSWHLIQCKCELNIRIEQVWSSCIDQQPDRVISTEVIFAHNLEPKPTVYLCMTSGCLTEQVLDQFLGILRFPLEWHQIANGDC